MLAIGSLVAAAPAAGDDGPATAPALTPDGVIVQWLPDADHGEKVAARADAEVTFEGDLGNREFQLVEVEAGQSPEDAVRALEADPAVAVAERDGYRTLDAVPNDPLFDQQWGAQNLGTGIDGFAGAVAGDDISLTAAWDRTVGSPSVVMADIDSGYRFGDGDLGPVAWTNPGEIPGNSIDDDGNGFVDDVHGYDFVGASATSPTSDNDPTDDNLISGGHGLHTAGIMGAAGNNGVGISGVARNATIMPLRVCANQPSSNETRCPNSSIIAAINYAGDNGAKVANMSLGGNTFNQTEVNAIAAHPGTLYVISAGNDGGNNDGGEAAPKGHYYPCDYRPTVDASPPVVGAIDNIVCVAATNQADGLASFSDWGATSVDLGAPGTEILSTFLAKENWLSDSFETNNFATKWADFGAPGYGRAGVGDGPLTSFGMTDTPGAAPEANHTYGVESKAAASIPAGTGVCRVRGMRFLKGSAVYGLIRDGSFSPELEFTPGQTAGSSMVTFQTMPILNLGGHSVKMFFEYRAGSSPTAAEGFWLDDVHLECFAPLSAPLAYEFLQGTSMAAPQVTGAAALLWSLKPSASVTEVREALLDSADPVASLSGKTVTGGRLDVAAALDELVPPGTETVAPDTAITSQPASSTQSTTAKFEFTRTDADAGTFECKLDGGAFAPCSSPDSIVVAAGAHTFQVRAKSSVGIVDPTPAAAPWTVTTPPTEPENQPPPEQKIEPTPNQVASCKVPKLAGLTLAKAKSALKTAGCTLGKVTKPKPKKGKKLGALVVRSSSPAAGASASGPVALKLGPKPSVHRH
jgi:subtilisin family serine protease